MIKNNKYILEKIEQWQSFKYVKSLLCRKEGCEEKLVGQEKHGKVVLVCPKCGLIQNYIPKAILEAQVTIPEKLLRNQFRSNLIKK